MTTVDVVVPCYNYARYLPGCVESVLRQDGVNVRVLIIDDASSDDTARVGSKLAAADARVHHRRHQENRGHIATYNEGLLEWSDAPYSVLLSADDLLLPGALSRATRIMEADRTIGMVYGRPLYVRGEAPLRNIPRRQKPHTRWSGNAWLEGRCRAGHNVISSPEVVVRGDVQRAVGGYRPELPHVADFEMWLRIAAVSNIAYVRGVPQALYRIHGTSMTTHRTRLVDLHERRRAFEMLFATQQIARAAMLHDLARSALAREALWAACRAYDHDAIEEANVAELVAFALATYPGASRLSESGALRRRQRLGPVLCRRTQLFAAPAMYRRVRKWFWWRRWERRGV